MRARGPRLKSPISCGMFLNCIFEIAFAWPSLPDDLKTGRKRERADGIRSKFPPVWLPHFLPGTIRSAAEIRDTCHPNSSSPLVYPLFTSGQACRSGIVVSSSKVFCRITIWQELQSLFYPADSLKLWLKPDLLQ